MNDYKIGDKGRARIVFDKPKYFTGVKTFGEITNIEEQYVYFTESEGRCFKVAKERFKFVKNKL